MSGFSLLWQKILRSSIWVKESKETRLVWITMLALKDSEGKIQASVPGLADAAKVSVAECREALRVFLSPDEDDTSKVEDGKRIREIAGGWEIINHDLYRFSTEAKREFWRQAKAEQREKVSAATKQRSEQRSINRMLKHSRSASIKGQQAHDMAERNGATPEELDKISDPDYGR